MTGAQQITIVVSESLVNIIVSTHFITKDLLVPRSLTPALAAGVLPPGTSVPVEAIRALVTMALDAMEKPDKKHKP